MENSKYYKTEFTDKDIEEFFENHSDTDALLDYPLVYLLYGKNRIYVGETSNVVNRMKSHLKDKEKNKLEMLSMIYHPKFNKSATYNIETNLIQHISADSSKLKVLNRTQNIIKNTHNYYDKNFFNQTLFNYVWETLLEEGLASDSIDEIRNKDVYKISPYIMLNEEQMEIRQKIVDFCIENKDNENGAILLVSGEAGTGKSVLLSSTLKELLDEASDNSSQLYGLNNNYLLVHHEEMRKTYQNIARKVANFKVGSFLKPTEFINRIDNGKLPKIKDNKADIVLIDEAHLLLTRPDAYNYFRYENHLEEIIKRSRITIVIFDERQVLKAKSYWDKNSFEILTRGKTFEKYELKTQMRMNTNEKSAQWINDFIEKKITKIPTDRKFDIKIFHDAEDMYQAIKKKESEVGLSRVVSTFDYIHKKDGSDYYVEEDNFSLPWNKSYKNTWAEMSMTINEVGSIYTIQGFDLNYVGVILGPSVSYDKNKHEVKIIPSMYQDTEAFRNIDNVYDYKGRKINPDTIKEEIILNSINVLMKRGIKGLYIFASDKDLRNELIKAAE